MSDQQKSSHSGATVYLNVVLTAIVLLLGALVMQSTIGLPTPEAAEAAQEQTRTGRAIGLPNAAEQRERMIRAIEKLDGRVAGLEKRLGGGGVDVKVVSIPPVQIKE